MKEPYKIYSENIQNFEAKVAVLKKKRSLIAWCRLLIIVLLFLRIYNQWQFGWPRIAVVFLIGIILFLFLVAKQVSLKSQLAFLEELIGINKKEIAGLDMQYADWFDGANYNSASHPYTADLDIFGKFSLFQYVNRAESEGGRSVLAKSLSYHTDQGTIESRQEAIGILQDQTHWCQDFQAFSKMADLDLSMETYIKQWLQTPISHTSKIWKWIIWIYPIVSLSTVYLYLNDTISASFFGIAISFFIAFSFFQSKKVNATFTLLSQFYPKISKLQKLLECLENMETGNSALLKDLHDRLSKNEEIRASQALNKLGKQLGLFEARLNIFLFFFLNTFLLWDVRVSIGLQEWKKQWGSQLQNWIETIYHAECFNSLAILSFNHPDWIFPTIESEYFNCKGMAIGHPLIRQDKRVNNDFCITGEGKIALITGSNMGGKSTFLRSLGINMVLAYAGAPVCAKTFHVSIAKLMSSMRIADNLSESTSTFYAELKKIKAIIEAVNSGEKVFVLLDEILRGTNSLDRHSGSKALMMQLIRKKAVAVIATHDVELAHLVTNEPDAIANYHFDVQVDSNESLYFDYKLKDGICQRMNAAILMKQIGIEF